MTALQAYERASQFQRDGKLDEAIAAYQEALDHDVNFRPAWYAQACAYETQGNHARALSCFQKTISLATDHAESHHNLGNSLFKLGLVDEALTFFQKAIQLGTGFLPRTSIATIIPGSPQANNQSILAARKVWGQTHLPARKISGISHALSEHRPTRVGYLSSFFAKEKWMNPVWGLFNQHDRGRIQIHLFSDAPEEQCRNAYQHRSEDQFHDISALSNQDAAQCIRENQLDILVDLNGYSRVDRMAVMALQPAPIQVGWFNFYATSGLACYDFLIGDEQVVPLDEERFYVEKILRLPGSYLTFEPFQAAPEIAEAPGAATRQITFGCLASSYKITHPVVDAWSRILQRVPHAKLFLKNTALGFVENRQFLQERFARHGIRPDCLIMEGPAKHFEFVSAYRQIDIALDTFPYNGGTTTMEALWQGVPVLTFYGDRWASRQGASLLRAAGLQEFVANSADDYVNRAVSLAVDPSIFNRLNAIRRDMRQNLIRSSVCDTRSFAGNMEELYRRMLRAEP